MKTLVLKMVDDMNECPKGAPSTFQLLQDIRMEWRPSGNTTLFQYLLYLIICITEKMV